MSAIGVTQLNVGWFTAASGIWRRGDPMDTLTRFPIPAFVIDTDRERILVDAGLHPGAVADSFSHYDGAPSMRGFRLEQEQGIEEQVDLDLITCVVITHLHFDHAGGLSLLPSGVPIVVQRREWEGAHNDESIARNFYLPRDYATIGERVRLVDGDHDLLGDGSIRLLLTPGHTPGHQSVMVGERHVIGADVSHFASGLEDHRFPLFADDHAAQARSAERLRVIRDAGAVVTPGHDPAVLCSGPMTL
jgi:glyoxylase-like metal-dependent hydrolase (beta-lactamase superfamily II)